VIKDCKKCNNYYDVPRNLCQECVDYNFFDEVDDNPYDYSNSEIYDVEDDLEF